MKQSDTQTILQFRRLMALTVCGLLGISQDDYADMMFEKGLDYIDELPETPARKEKLAVSALFWEWWKTTWAYLDHEWIEWQIGGYTLTDKGVEDGGASRLELWLQYVRFHNSRDIAKDTPPPKFCFSK